MASAALLKLFLASLILLCGPLLDLGAGQEPSAVADQDARTVIPFPEALMEAAKPVPPERMRRVYEEVKTPYKYGIVLQGEPGEQVDCPSIFRANGRWYMLFVSIHESIGYETCLAVSDDLLRWERLGKVLPFSGEGWDQWQANGRLALVDHEWGGSMEWQAFEGRHWLTYVGGALQGYETDPLSIEIAWTETPVRPRPWQRFESNPVLSSHQPDARPFEAKTLYTSHVIWDREEHLGWPFVMYYNGKDAGSGGHERIGMAVSRDMREWHRFGEPGNK